MTGCVLFCYVISKNLVPSCVLGLLWNCVSNKNSRQYKTGDFFESEQYSISVLLCRGKREVDEWRLNRKTSVSVASDLNKQFISVRDNFRHQHSPSFSDTLICFYSCRIWWTKEGADLGPPILYHIALKKQVV